ncbi:MAG: transposase [Actinomycetia bacterium]|nr:transposase [Actinomycetes bacterium]
MRAVIFGYFGTLTDPGAEEYREPVAHRTGELLGVCRPRFRKVLAGSFGERTIGVHGGTESTLRAVARSCGANPSSAQLAVALPHHRSGHARLRQPRIDRVAMASGRDRPYYSGKQKAHGVNVQVVAGPAGRLIWVSPALPGARHDLGAAREHGLPGALAAAGVRALADTAYQGAGPAVTVPQRRRRLDPGTGRYRPLSQNQKDVNTAHARLRGPGERANAELKNWKVLRKIRSSPSQATTLVNAVQTLILAG